MPYTLKQIKELREKITPGQWRVVEQLPCGIDYEEKDLSIVNDANRLIIDSGIEGDAGVCKEDDAYFIVAAPSIIDQLLLERRIWRQKVEDLKRKGLDLTTQGWNEALSEVLKLLED